MEPALTSYSWSTQPSIILVKAGSALTQQNWKHLAKSIEQQMVQIDHKNERPHGKNNNKIIKQINN